MFSGLSRFMLCCMFEKVQNAGPSADSCAQSKCEDNLHFLIPFNPLYFLTFRTLSNMFGVPRYGSRNVSFRPTNMRKRRRFYMFELHQTRQIHPLLSPTVFHVRKLHWRGAASWALLSVTDLRHKNSAQVHDLQEFVRSVHQPLVHNLQIHRLRSHLRSISRQC